VNGVDEFGESWFGTGKNGWTVGRDPKAAKSIINEGSFIGKALELYCPAMETMSIDHDKLTGAIKSKYGKTAFDATNAITMPPLYVGAVVKESAASASKVATAASKGAKAAGSAVSKGGKAVLEAAKRLT